MVKNEFSEALREITMLGFGIILVCHEKEKPTGMCDEEGNPLTRVEPDGPRQMREIIDALVDIIGYIGVEFDPATKENVRYLYTRQSPTVFAGSRYQYLSPRIKFGYQELVNAIGEAIDEDVRVNGAKVADKIEQAPVKTKTFAEVLEEARTLWIKYLETASNEEDKEQRLRIMKDIIKNIFGNEEFRLSQALPSQIDLIDLFCSEVKELL